MNKCGFGILLLFCLSACVGNKALISTSSQSVNVILKNSQQKAAQVDWFTATLKGKADLNNNQFPISAQLRMRKDSVIWISVSALLGLEAARIMLTPDTLKVINRLNSSYFVGEVSALSKQYNIPLTFDELQNALLGAHSFDKDNRFKLQESEQDYLLVADKDMPSYVLRLSADYLPKTILSTLSDSAYVSLSYPSFVNVNTQWLPQGLDIEAITNNKSLSASFSYSKMLINIPKKTKFSIPSSYAPM